MPQHQPLSISAHPAPALGDCRSCLDSGFQNGTDSKRSPILLSRSVDAALRVDLNPFTFCEVHWAGRRVYKCGEWFCKRGNMIDRFFVALIFKVPRQFHCLMNCSREDCDDTCKSNQICADRRTCVVHCIRTGGTRPTSTPPQTNRPPRSLSVGGKLADTSQEYEWRPLGRVNQG